MINMVRVLDLIMVWSIILSEASPLLVNNTNVSTIGIRQFDNLNYDCIESGSNCNVCYFYYGAECPAYSNYYNQSIVTVSGVDECYILCKDHSDTFIFNYTTHGEDCGAFYFNPNTGECFGIVTSLPCDENFCECCDPNETSNCNEFSEAEKNPTPFYMFLMNDPNNENECDEHLSPSPPPSFLH